MNPTSGIEPKPTSDQKTTHWLLRLIMWDGILPLIVWACPAFFRWWLKNNEMNVIFTASIIPSVALVHLVCLESLLIMMQELPELKDIDAGEVMFLVTAYLIYLLPMAFVLYPGQVSSNGSADEELSGTRTNYFGGEESLS